MVKQQHTRITQRLAGRAGKREVPIKGGGRLDVRKPKVAIEVERSADRARLRRAVNRLQRQPGVRHELRVPQTNLDKATEVAKRMGVPLTVKNLSGTRRRRVS